MQHCDTLIHAGIIVSQDEERQIFYNSSIAIVSGRIADLAPSEEIKKHWLADQVLDLPQSMLLPGLINAHTHAAMTFLRGFADDLSLLEWLQTKIFPVESRLTAEIVRLGSLLGYAEMLACGVTACVDMYLFENAVLEAAEQAGIRCMGGEAVFSFPSPACQNYREALEKTEDLADKFAQSSRIQIAVNPHSVYTTNAEILSACRELALRRNLPLHIHLAESPSESANSLKLHQLRPVEYCAQNGLFDCRLLAAHLVDLTPSEIALLAQKGVFAIHNPSSNMKLASGVSPIPALMEAGITVGLGTDGAASNNTLNIFHEMNRAALLHKLANNDPATLPAGAVLDMATRNGAKIMGYSDLGSLAPGMRADCIAIDLTLPHMLPMHQPVSQLVYAASGHECQMTMIEGEIVYHNGKYSRFDYSALREEAKDLYDFAHNKRSAV